MDSLAATRERVDNALSDTDRWLLWATGFGRYTSTTAAESGVVTTSNPWPDRLGDALPGVGANHRAWAIAALGRLGGASRKHWPYFKSSKRETDQRGVENLGWRRRHSHDAGRHHGGPDSREIRHEGAGGRSGRPRPGSQSDGQGLGHEAVIGTPPPCSTRSEKSSPTRRDPLR